MLINIIITKSKPISAKNFSSDKKYHGNIPMSTIVAVRAIALPRGRDGLLYRFAVILIIAKLLTDSTK